MRVLISLILISSFGCRRKTAEAPPAFSDAIVQLFVQFDEDEATVAENLRAIERQVYLGMDVEASNPADRALAPERLTEADVDHIEHPDRPTKDALPISVAGLSPHGVGVSHTLQLQVDHRPWEPYSPTYYERTFIEGEDCWGDKSCDWLVTWNDLTKENLLMTVDYGFYKDFRWIDLAEDGEPRWAVLARSWTPEVYQGNKANTAIQQSFTIEAWIPRDGRGFQRTAKDKNVDDGEWNTDSQGGGVLRMLTLWSETDVGFAVSDDAVIATTRSGIDDNFKAADDYLSENAR